MAPRLKNVWFKQLTLKALGLGGKSSGMYAHELAYFAGFFFVLWASLDRLEVPAVLNSQDPKRRSNDCPKGARVILLLE